MLLVRCPILICEFDSLTYSPFYSGGFQGIYSGYGASVIGVFVFRALYLGGYDITKELYELDNPGTSHFARYVAAQSVTTIVGTLCYPIDTIKRRMMMQGGGMQSYNGAFHCFSSIIRDEGFRGLFHGLSVNLFRGFFGAMLLVLYDGIKPIVKEYIEASDSGGDNNARTVTSSRTSAAEK